MLGVVVVSYNTSELTLACLRSLAGVRDLAELRVVVVDNASDADELRCLRTGLRELDLPAIELVEMERNTGFAGGCNHAIAMLLSDPAVDRVLLLNNDSVLVGGGLAALLAFADANPQADMVGAAMYCFDDPTQVDSRGITMYASALASNRKHSNDRLLGPTGGLALYSRTLLETVRDRHGMIFDERFFCYAEDTDLALRAHLLGFKAAFLDRCVALHHGQASSGGGFSDFVLYHGIRNSIWVLVKGFPLPWLLLLSPLILTLHGAIAVRHGLGGRARVVWRLYRDACRGIPGMYRSRRTIQATRQLSLLGFGRLLTPRFYDRKFLRNAWHELWHGRSQA